MSSLSLSLCPFVSPPSPCPATSHHLAFLRRTASSSFLPHTSPAVTFCRRQHAHCSLLLLPATVHIIIVLTSPLGSDKFIAPIPLPTSLPTSSFRSPQSSVSFVEFLIGFVVCVVFFVKFIFALVVISSFKFDLLNFFVFPISFRFLFF